jgi:RNA polymerase sigma-70 factor (ECF subfamily)
VETESTQIQNVQRLLERINRGDGNARNALIEVASTRLMQLTRSMKRGYAAVNRWEQTDDVFQRSIMRLHRALQEVAITDARHFFRLAATQIRRELIDLTRHYCGPQGLGANYVTQLPDQKDSQTPLHAAYDAVDPSVENPFSSMQWSELHEAIEALPKEQQEVVELLFYNALSQEEAADVLGVSTRTIKRYWRNARLKLFESFGGELPGIS